MAPSERRRGGAASGPVEQLGSISVMLVTVTGGGWRGERRRGSWKDQSVDDVEPEAFNDRRDEA